MNMDGKQAIMAGYLTHEFVGNIAGIESIAKEADLNLKTKNFVRDYFRSALFFHEQSGISFTEEELISITKPVSITHYGLLQNLRLDDPSMLKFSGPFQIYNDIWFRMYMLAMAELLDKSHPHNAIKRFYEAQPIEHIVIDWATARMEGYKSGEVYKGSVRSLQGTVICLWYGVLDIEMAYALGQKTLEESIGLLNRL